MSKVYFQPMTEAQRLYYDFHRTNGRGAAMLPVQAGPDQHYLARYELLTGVHRHLHPFSFLRPGQNVVTVGVHDGFIDLGYSMPFITASLVGPRGRVATVDIDERNIKAVKAYSKSQHGAPEIRTVHKGVWNQRGEQEFLFFNDFTSSNMAVSAAESRLDKLTRKWGDDRVQEMTFRATVPVDTLDAIVEEHELARPVHFLNVAVNGVEMQVLESATGILDSPELEAVSIPYRYTTFDAAQYLMDRGFSIAVAEGNTKSWDDDPFYFAVATRESKEALAARGFVPAEVIADEDMDCGFQVRY